MKSCDANLSILKLAKGRSRNSSRIFNDKLLLRNDSELLLPGSSAIDPIRSYISRGICSHMDGPDEGDERDYNT